MKAKAICATMLLAGWLAGTARANVTLFGDVTLIPPPASAKPNDLEDNKIVWMWQERQAYALPSPVTVDIHLPGRYDTNYNRDPAIIPAGTLVNSYFLHFDAVGTTGAITGGQVITFSEEILGILCRASTLDPTDNVLGYPGTLYSTGVGARGFESGVEDVSLSDDRRSLLIHNLYTTYPGEEVRIITAVPEPTTLSLLALSGLPLLRRRGAR